MSVTDVVCDASVALKWFHSAGEEEVDSARALLDRYRERAVALEVLDLTPYEIGNALLRGGPGVPADQVATVLEALSEICTQLTPTTPELRDAVLLAGRHDLTLYDAAYAAVAQARGAHLATLDRQLLDSGLGRRPSAILEDLS